MIIDASTDLGRNDPQAPHPATRFFTFSVEPVPQEEIAILDRHNYPVGSVFLLFRKASFTRAEAWTKAVEAMGVNSASLCQRNPFRKAHTRLYWVYVKPNGK